MGEKNDSLIKREKIFDNIIVTSGTKREAIRIISRLCATHRLVDASELEEAFLKREEWDSTGCGEGIAIPHAIIKGTSKVQLAIIRFRYPIDWEAFDDKPVDIAFAIIAPEEKGQERYLAFLSSLARKLVDEDFILDFRKCKNEDEIYEYITEKLKDC